MTPEYVLLSCRQDRTAYLLNSVYEIFKEIRVKQFCDDKFTVVSVYPEAQTFQSNINPAPLRGWVYVLLECFFEGMDETYLRQRLEQAGEL